MRSEDNDTASITAAYRSENDVRVEGRELSVRIRRLELGVVVLMLALAAAAAWTALRPSGADEVLTAERLEIVEPDGKLAFVLANSARPVSATIDGQVLLEGQEEERRHPTIIFFDGKGDEVGGMTFANEETEDGFSAVRHFAVDGYEQDETVALRHHQDPEGARSGLQVTDRPRDRSLVDVLEGLGLQVPVTRDELDAAVDSLREEGSEEELRDFFGVSRLFLGSDRDDRASLVLRDGQGRTRVLLAAPANAGPYIRFLDEEGEVVLELPE